MSEHTVVKLDVSMWSTSMCWVRTQPENFLYNRLSIGTIRFSSSTAVNVETSAEQTATDAQKLQKLKIFILKFFENFSAPQNFVNLKEKTLKQWNSPSNGTQKWFLKGKKSQKKCCEEEKSENLIFKKQKKSSKWWKWKSWPYKMSSCTPCHRPKSKVSFHLSKLLKSPRQVKFLEFLPETTPI